MEGLENLTLSELISKKADALEMVRYFNWKSVTPPYCNMRDYDNVSQSWQNDADQYQEEINKRVKNG